MEPKDLETKDLIKQFHALRSTSSQLSLYAHEISQRTDKYTCLYMPLRGKNRNPCKNNSTTAYGYCTKHKYTIQAKKMADKYNNALKAYVEPQTPAEVEEEQPSAEVEEEQPSAEVVEEPQPSGEVVEEPQPSVEVVEQPPTEVEEQPRVETTNSFMPRRYTERETLAPSESGSEQQENSEGEIKLKLRRNKEGNYEHVKSKIVFDISKEVAYGVQYKSNVYNLGPKEIAYCKRKGWPYMIPNEDPSNESSDESGHKSASYQSTSSEEESSIYNTNTYSSEESSGYSS